MTDDEKFIERCFQLALKGKGNVSPNPLVGCVIVKDGKIIGEGWHEKFGNNHAEVNAINNSSENIEGAILYCNLEPCVHINKQTPPCVDKIIESKISKVVISNIDPNPYVSGKGIEKLKNVGIAVEQDILKDKGEYLNRFFFKYIKEKVPYITIKIAQTLDGKISKTDKEQTWITCKESDNYVHKMRSYYDAVLVGTNTIKIDNPQLNVRNVEGRNPIKVIIDGKLSSPVDSKVFLSEPEKTYLFTMQKSNDEKINILKDRGVRIFQLENDNCEKLDLNTIIKILGNEKIISLIVEGGNKIFSQFIEQELFDDIIIIQAPIFMGDGLNATNLVIEKKLEIKFYEKLGRDLKIELIKI